MLGSMFGLSVAVTGSASAASPHFKPRHEPVCTLSGTTSVSVTCSGVLAGLGNEDLQIDVSLSGQALYQCQNPGGRLVPGQNKVLEGPATSTTSIPAEDIKNGTLTFTTNPAVLTAAATVSAAEAGCPNNNWVGVNPKLTVTSIELVIQQPPGTVIFDCTATDPSGLTQPITLACQ
jgi:hypothetical protein